MCAAVRSSVVVFPRTTKTEERQGKEGRKEGRKAVLSLHVSLALPLTRHFGPSDDSPQIYAFSAALLTTNITCSHDRARTLLHEPIFW